MLIDDDGRLGSGGLRAKGIFIYSQDARKIRVDHSEENVSEVPAHEMQIHFEGVCDIYQLNFSHLSMHFLLGLLWNLFPNVVIIQYGATVRVL